MTTTGTPAPEDVPAPNISMPVGEGAPPLSEGGRPFQSYMQGKEPNPLLSTKPGQVSPFDLAHGQVPAVGPNLATITQQAKQAQAALGDISTQLNTPNLKLKPASKYILKNKLGSAKASIKAASAKMGAPEKADTQLPAGANPLQRFLGLVSDGQNQLEAAQSQLSNIAARGEQMSPADMLLVQIKLNKAQQELEYSSLLLSKAIDDLKTLMNIQL